VLRPRPVSVDLAIVGRGAMRVTIEEEARTRVRSVYTVSAPVAGKLLRIALDAGDVVERDKTTVAVIEPATPPLLDVRARSEAEARVAAAEAAVALSEAELRQARSEAEFAASELKRSEALAKSRTIPDRTLEKARLEADVRQATLARAEAGVAVRQRELDTARASLTGHASAGGIDEPDGACCVTVRSPVSGRVLKRIQASETVLPAGAPLVEVGDVGDLEIVADLLSADAVRLRPGAEATVTAWGGPETLPARVRRIEPAGFTKVSALGIEEQRVRVVLDFDAPPEVRRRLGHDFRVYVAITTWSAPDVLRVPLSALFRDASRWAVFRVVGGRAELVAVDIGHRNSEHAEIVSGLGPGDRVVLHPSDRVAPGVRLAPRTE
jgi:HlyD family secretion protein